MAIVRSIWGSSETHEKIWGLIYSYVARNFDPRFYPTHRVVFFEEGQRDFSGNNCKAFSRMLRPPDPGIFFHDLEIIIVKIFLGGGLDFVC